MTKRTDSEPTDLNRALVDALPDAIAVVSADAKIVSINQAWKRFGRENGNPKLLGAQVGANYLSACRTDAGDGAQLARVARSGIMDVLHGIRSHFAMEYSCDSPDQMRWFRMEVFPIRSTSGLSAIIHRDVTEHERLRRALREYQAHDEAPIPESAAPSIELAPRQRQVLELVAKGFENREIAFTMGITIKTVDYHLRALKKKLGKNRRAELVRAGIAVR